MNRELALVVGQGAADLDLPNDVIVERVARDAVVLYSHPFESHQLKSSDVGGGKVAISGMAVVDGSLVYPGKNERLLVGGPESESWAVGSFLAFVVSKRGGQAYIRVINDLFGLTPIFECRHQGRLVIANSLDLAIRAARALQIPLETDPIGVVSSMFSDAGIGLQVSTPRTPYSPIRLLPLAGDFDWCVDGVRVHYISQVARAERIAGGATADDYLHFLRLGTQDVIRTVDAVTRASCFDRHLVNITGGKDSRWVVAAIQSLGNTDKWRGITNGSEEDADVRIGTGIAQLAGISYLDEPIGSVIPVGADDVLSMRQRFYRGTYHEIRTPTGRVQEGGFGRSVRLIGGCGELYRGFYHRRFPVSDLDGPPTAEIIFKRLREKAHRRAYQERMLVPFRELLRECLISSGSSLSDALSRHYMEFRHRLHIGYAGMWNSWMNPPTVNPLASPYLYVASRLLNRREREGGRLVHDSVSMISGSLAEIEYDDIGWNSRWTSKPAVPAPMSIDAWLGANKRRANASARPRPKRLGREWPAALKAVEAAGWEALRDHDLANEINVSELESHVAALVDKNRRLYRVWVSRLAMFTDLP